MEIAKNPLTRESREVLKKVALFDALKELPGAMDAIAQIMYEKSYEKGDVLTQEGQEGVEYFILNKGEVAIHRNTPEGDSYKVVVLKAEKHPAFGEGGLIEGERRSATVICETEVHCLVLDRQSFKEFCVNQPQFALPIVMKIAQSIINRLNQTSRDMMLLHKALMDEIRSN